MTIRRLAESDASAWWSLRLQALETDSQAFGKTAEEHRETPLESISERFRDSGDGNFTLGAFDGHVLVGMITFIRNSGIKDRHKGNIYGVYVDPAYRGKNLARKLLDEIIEFAKGDPSIRQLALAVAARNLPAKRLYERAGFVTWGTEPQALKDGSSFIDEEHMSLLLR